MTDNNNEHAAVARLTKAMKIADAIEKAGGSADDAMAFDIEGWRNASNAAEAQFPSSATQAMVVSLLRTRADAVDVDPFEGLS